MQRSVGAYEAKTHLPRLLEEVAAGNTITITKRGVPVAVLVPVTQDRRREIEQAIEELKRLSGGLTLDGLNVREMIEEGRV
jgi:prevent-host-death family protein